MRTIKSFACRSMKKDALEKLSFAISDPVHFEVNWVSIPSSVYMLASSIAAFQKTKRVSRSEGNQILFLLNLFKKFISINLMFDITVTIISNSSVCINFL